MSDINPKGVPITINGEERHFLFDYSVIAEIQEAYESDVLTAIRKLWMEKMSPGEYQAKVLIDLTHKLLLAECERAKFFTGEELKVYTRRQVGWLITQLNADEIVNAILSAWMISMPKQEEKQEEKDPNVERGTTRKKKTSTSPRRS